jgi:hypothetical protein
LTPFPIWNKTEHQTKHESEVAKQVNAVSTNQPYGKENSGMQ